MPIEEANQQRSSPVSSDVAAVPALIGIGSNLDSVVGDRLDTIASAVEQLGASDGVQVLAVAGVIETPPWTPEGVEVEQGPYLNSAALIDASIGARDLLALLLSLESAHGRDRSRGHRWGPRTLDLDLLIYGESVIDEDGLVVPHPRMTERLFVLGPASVVAPGMVIPGAGVRIDEALARIDGNGT